MNIIFSKKAKFVFYKIVIFFLNPQTFYNLWKIYFKIRIFLIFEILWNPKLFKVEKTKTEKRKE